MKAPHPKHGNEHNWEETRERQARVEAATAVEVRLSPERARVVMEDRARALARVPPRAPNAAEVIEVVTFRVANENYAIETRHVREVVPFADVTRVPGAPAFLAGLINFRGDVLAVFDLRKLFGSADAEATDLSRVIVLGSERVEFGVLAVAVREVLVLRIDEVHEAPGSVADVGWEYLRGVTAAALIVLDGAALLRDVRLFIDLVDDNGH
jgi:purine-binding chemotaxis protein CheW